MARHPRQAAIDAHCKEWGRTRRKIVGVDDPELSKEYIGALRSTLGQRRDLHAGAKSNKVDQHWPELYENDAAIVNQAYHAMRPDLRMVMELHYAARAPAERKANFLCISIRVYWDRVNEVRTFVDGYMARSDAA